MCSIRGQIRKGRGSNGVTHDRHQRNKFRNHFRSALLDRQEFIFSPEDYHSFAGMKILALLVRHKHQ